MARRRLVSAIQFFPRGGSSHVARALATELPAHGWDVTRVAGSRVDLGGLGDARDFYAGLDILPVSFDDALASPDPLDPPAGAVPMQPSYEDRPGAPDRVFAALDDHAFERRLVLRDRLLTRFTEPKQRETRASSRGVDSAPSLTFPRGRRMSAQRDWSGRPAR